jgi:DNA-binding response OmpR family regulator
MENITEKSKKVCIIDDDGMIRDMYETKFKLEGFAVVSAVDGEAGLKLIREQKPDIILLDLMMPVKSGLEVLEELRKDKSICAIPVIILSNVSDEKTLSEVEKFDTHFYVVKALATPQKVVDIVHEVLHW